MSGPITTAQYENRDGTYTITAGMRYASKPTHSSTPLPIHTTVQAIIPASESHGMIVCTENANGRKAQIKVASLVANYVVPRVDKPKKPKPRPAIDALKTGVSLTELIAPLRTHVEALEALIQEQSKRISANYARISENEARLTALETCLKQLGWKKE